MSQSWCKYVTCLSRTSHKLKINVLKILISCWDRYLYMTKFWRPTDECGRRRRQNTEMVQPNTTVQLPPRDSTELSVIIYKFKGPKLRAASWENDADVSWRSCRGVLANQSPTDPPNPRRTTDSSGTTSKILKLQRSLDAYIANSLRSKPFVAEPFFYLQNPSQLLARNPSAYG